MVIAGIVAGGTGSRMGQNIMPKQFLELAGKPIIVHTIEKFLACTEIDYVIAGVHPDWLGFMHDLVEKYFRGETRLAIASGGTNRNETIWNIAQKAREEFHADEDTILVTHDAVRPFLSLRIIFDNVAAAEKYGACDTVVGATDTIVQSDNLEYITAMPIRKYMYQGQTPQSFRLGLFENVYENMTEEEVEQVTDACKLFLLRGYKVYLVEGDVANFKITYPFDLKMAKTMIEENHK